jgi:hypothetical protein
MFDVHGRRLPQGTQKAFCAEHRLSRPTVMRMVRTGGAILNEEGTKLVVAASPVPRGTAASEPAPFKQRPAPEPQLPPSWAERCAAFELLTERMVAHRPADMSREDAFNDLVGRVRQAFGHVLRASGRSVS